MDPIQGGAGTFLNMNANEVIVNRAIECLGGQKGDYSIVNPNDHVNCSQSTNDVIPTAGKMTSLRLLQHLKAEFLHLHTPLCQKAEEFDHVIKIGRTQMQDAVPIRLGQEFHVYSVAIHQAFDLIDATQNLDSFVVVSDAIKACPVTLSKIANDLRLMSSAPEPASMRSTFLPSRTAPPSCPARSIP